MEELEREIQIVTKRLQGTNDSEEELILIHELLSLEEQLRLTKKNG